MKVRIPNISDGMAKILYYFSYSGEIFIAPIYVDTEVVKNEEWLEELDEIIEGMALDIWIAQHR